MGIQQWLDENKAKKIAIELNNQIPRCTATLEPTWARSRMPFVFNILQETMPGYATSLRVRLYGEYHSWSNALASAYDTWVYDRWEIDSEGREVQLDTAKAMRNTKGANYYDPLGLHAPVGELMLHLRLHDVLRYTPAGQGL